MWLKDEDLVLQLEYHSHIKWREFLPQVEVSKHNAYKETTLHVLKWSRPMLVTFPPVYVRKKHLKYFFLVILISPCLYAFIYCAVE